MLQAKEFLTIINIRGRGRKKIWEKKRKPTTPRLSEKIRSMGFKRAIFC